jgi:hypothetical protein
MKIKEITYQHRRDFSAIYKCEWCGHEQKDDSGYDDSFYHDSVIPNKKCKSCGESTLSKEGAIDNTETRYPEGYQI